jgi:dTDP-4-amino-4,6-dideoxygalactose transaminase
MPYKIPFNRPSIVGRELEYVAEAVALGNIGGDGRFTRECSELLKSRFGIAELLMTPSCTSALEMAAMLCDLGPHDEVIMPSFTFVSTANAVVRTGARPVFVDIRDDTLNLDERLIEQALSPRTKAIFPVHYGGVGCEMDSMMQIARDHQLLVVEDAAQAVNASYRGRSLGSIGDLATYSFHETKNYICGEGGALCINRRELYERACTIRDKGTNRQQFMQGRVDKYTWVDVGGSYVPSEIVSAFLLGQLQEMDNITRQRSRIYENYQLQFAALEQQELIRLPRTPQHCQSNYHLMYLLVADRPTRDQLIQHLADREILAVFHYVPLHNSPMGKKLGCDAKPLPVTESVSDRLIRLPMFYDLDEASQQLVIDEVMRFFGQVAA